MTFDFDINIPQIGPGVRQTVEPRGNRPMRVFDGFDLAHIDPTLRHLAVRAIESRDVQTLFCLTDGHRSQHLLEDNARWLVELGLYEKALVDTWTRAATASFSAERWSKLFALADRERLRAAGDPLPVTTSELTVYRGVDRHYRHGQWARPAWTLQSEIASWFAYRVPTAVKPTVYRLTVPKVQVLFFANERQEHEVVLSPDYLRRYKKTHLEVLPLEEVARLAEQERQRRRVERDRKCEVSNVAGHEKRTA